MAEDQVEPATGNVLDNDLAGDGSAAAGWAVVAIDDSADQVGQPLAGAFGTLTVHADGSYSHTVDNDRPEVQALRAGETLTETHTYTALDAAGEPVTGTLTLTITGTNDAPVIAGEAVWLDLVAPASEPAEPEADAAAPGELVEVGQFDFTDVDLGDVHTLEDPVAPEGALGALTIELLADSAAGGTQDAPAGAIAWTYRVSAQALAHLAEGETVTETYTFALLDDQGGRVEQQVTVSLTGTNDAPFIAVDDPQLVVDASLTEADAPLSAQGRLVFGDVDAADSAAGADAALAPWCEVVDQILLSDSVALTPGQELALLAGFQGIDAATGEWAYAIDSPDFLPEGSEVSAVYTVRVMDGHGAFVDQAVSVTIRGSNDAPVIVGAPLLGREGVELTVSDADNGTELTFQIGDTVLDPTASPVTNALDWPDADPTRFVPVEQADAVLSGVLLVTDGLAAVDTGLAVVLGRGVADALVAPGADGDDDGDDGGGRPTALWGFGGRDTLVGGAGDDRLDGGDGNDVLEGGAGWDLLIGGAGRDTFDIRAQGDGSADYVTDLSDRDRLIVADGGSLDADLVADLQPGEAGHGYVATRRGLVVDGEARLYNTGGFTVDLSAASGARGVYLEDESAHGAAMTGTARADTLVGGAGADALAGGGGSDLLVGGTLAQPDDGRLGAADTFVIDGDDTVQDLSGTDVLIVRRGASLVAHVTGDYTAGAGSTVEGDGDARQGDGHGHDNDRGSDHDHDHDSRADGESDRGDADGHGDGPAERDGDRGEDDRSDDGRADPRSDAGGDAVRPAALTLLSDGHDVDLSAVTSRDGRGLRIENTAADGRGVDGDPTEGPSGVTFVGSAGDDTLVGGALGDVLAGGAGADRIYGSAAVAQGVAAIEAVIAADRDRAAEPGDRGDRGEPGDRATTSDAETWARHVAAALADGVDDRTGADPLALDEIDGGAGDDRIVAGNVSAWVHGGRGDDVIVAGQGPSVLAGDAGNDLIVAGDARVAGAAEGDEAFDATQGASPVLVAGHVIDGGAGDDTVHSGAGDDLLIGAGGDDLLHAGAGDDAVFGGRGDDRLFGDAGADWLDGDVGRDTLQGGDGDDRLDGGAQADRLVGGAGDDLYVVDDAGDAVVERAGEGSDTVLASVSWQLDAEVENLTLTGSADLDGTGNRQANGLIGNTGANRLSGGGGADFLTGGGGADVLSGGAGSDVFVFGAGDSAFTIGIDTGHDGGRRGRASGEVRGQDVITDFTLGGGDGGRGGHEGHGGQDGAGDRLDTGGRAHVAADTGGAVDGVDSALTVGRQAVGSHAIHDGVAVFNGGDVRIASQGDLAAVVQYLQANPLGDAGTTVAFTGRIDGVAHTWVYTQGDAAAEGDVSHDGLVDLVGVRADGLTQDPTHAPGSYIVIS